MMAIVIAVSAAGCNRTLFGLGSAVSGAMIAGGAVAAAADDSDGSYGGKFAVVGGVALFMLTIVGAVIGSATGVDDPPAKEKRTTARRPAVVQHRATEP
jgi:hypothetical protein